jgi:hypothetical protein
MIELGLGEQTTFRRVTRISAGRPCGTFCKCTFHTHTRLQGGPTSLVMLFSYQGRTGLLIPLYLDRRRSGFQSASVRAMMSG